MNGFALDILCANVVTMLILGRRITCEVQSNSFLSPSLLFQTSMNRKQAENVAKKKLDNLMKESKIRDREDPDSFTIAALPPTGKHDKSPLKVNMVNLTNAANVSFLLSGLETVSHLQINSHLLAKVLETLYFSGKLF